jgi:hypothetical protein
VQFAPDAFDLSTYCQRVIFEQLVAGFGITLGTVSVMIEFDLTANPAFPSADIVYLPSHLLIVDRKGTTAEVMHRFVAAAAGTLLGLH